MLFERRSSSCSDPATSRRFYMVLEPEGMFAACDHCISSLVTGTGCRKFRCSLLSFAMPEDGGASTVHRSRLSQELLEASRLRLTWRTAWDQGACSHGLSSLKPPLGVRAEVRSLLRFAGERLGSTWCRAGLATNAKLQYCRNILQGKRTSHALVHPPWSQWL